MSKPALTQARPGEQVLWAIDALAVWQEAGDLVAPVATGSTHGARHRRWLELLQAAPVVRVAYDGDDPGHGASRYWLDGGPGSGEAAPGDDS